MTYTFKSANDFIKSDKSKDFPFTKLQFTDKEIKEMFNKLEKYDVKTRFLEKEYNIKNINFNKSELKFINKHLLIINKNSDYDDWNRLSDIFNEKCRLKCILYGENSSAYDYYFKNIKFISEYAIQHYKKITPFTLRESLYNNHKECTSHRPNIIMSLIQLFNSTTVLDFSSGWGDRLLGAMASDIKYYCGIDPNECLHENYNKMIKFFGKSEKKFVMIESTIEEAKIPNKKFDLIFTSPPYFNLEIYSKNNKQSTSKFQKEKDWFNGFLKTALLKSWDKLIDGGYLCININQKNKNENYIRWMLKFMCDDIIDSNYMGVISYSNEKIENPQPIWIWKKFGTIKEDYYNPEIIIEPLKFKNKTFNIIRDDNLVGGTKQRAVVELLINSDGHEFIYAGPVFGYAQIALAYAARLTHKKATIFVEKRPVMHPFTKKAKNLGAKIIEIEQPTFLKDIQNKAKIYFDTESKKVKHKIVLLPFGLDDINFKNILEKNIKKAWPKNIDISSVKKMWLVAGSATLLNVFYKIFPKTNFTVIQVGKTIWPDQLNQSRTKLIISDERFVDNAKIMPPYPSVSTYDAKIWKYVIKYGSNNDYIWNVGKDI